MRKVYYVCMRTVRVYSPADIGRYSIIKTERDHITTPRWVGEI